VLEIRAFTFLQGAVDIVVADIESIAQSAQCGLGFLPQRSVRVTGLPEAAANAL